MKVSISTTSPRGATVLAIAVASILNTEGTTHITGDVDDVRMYCGLPDAATAIPAAPGYEDITFGEGSEIAEFVVCDHLVDDADYYVTLCDTSYRSLKRLVTGTTQYGLYVLLSYTGWALSPTDAAKTLGDGANIVDMPNEDWYEPRIQRALDAGLFGSRGLVGRPLEVAQSIAASVINQRHTV